MSGFTSRVADRAAGITPVRVLLTVLVAPLWLLGVLVALVWLVLKWSIGAFMVGFDTVQARSVQGQVASEGEP